ncbi:hypothetical protein I4U23_002566 [Adineta vaga]|nr:hypothetical protein I4U23_002566 [Adineta vaga]
MLGNKVQSQCLGGIWTIQDATTGSFTVSWRYDSILNVVEFIIQGQANSNINLTSTYIALSWSDITPTNNVDIALIFPTAQTLWDGYSHEQTVPAIDNQQDICVVQTNTTNQNFYATFQRSISTEDTNDISFVPNVYLMFSMGTYTELNDTDRFNLSSHFFRKSHETSVNLINCVSIGCLTLDCSATSCSCLQDISSNVGQCTCFLPPPPPPSSSSSSCQSNSTKSASVMMASSISALINGSCENQTDPCSSHGNCLQISSTHFICQCKAGYTGVLCQTALFSPSINILNMCQCLNGGVCLSNTSCSCPERYRGKYCQIMNPCNDYCQNNGHCTVDCMDTSCSTPTCACVNGYSGDQCKTIIIDACLSNPCVNGNCTPTFDNGFQCECNHSYIGLRCDKINSCLSNPCNRGKCMPSSNCLGHTCNYSCLCSNDTTGAHCEISTNPCLSSPCQNNGSCSILSNSYKCECVSPYNGTNCESIMNVCISNPCLNKGKCIRSSNIEDGMYRCDCPMDYIGLHCEYRDITCKTIFCENNGTCLMNKETNISYCQCPLNTTGSRCETIQELCTNTTCSNNGICFTDISTNNSRTHCICNQTFTGRYCEKSLVSLNSCSKNPCGSNGVCIPTSKSTYYCICSNGLNGQSCNSSTLTSCAGSPCRYLSTCEPIENTNPPNYQCVCPSYLTGDRCQYTNTCQKQPCVNHGRCIPLGPQNNFMCLCPEGFGHYDCSIYLGLSCNSNVCLNGGICDHNDTNIRCLCSAEFAGPRCEWASVCSINTCQNGGICRQIAPTMAECLCQTGFTGPTCSLRDSCTKLPCQRGGGCTTLLADTGTNWSAYRCICPPGVYGQNCDTAISSCSNMLCPKYKICSEQPTGPICICPENKVGSLCQYDNPCFNPICRHGGICSVVSNITSVSFTCTCPSLYTGQYCETALNTSQDINCISTCMNGGSCVNGICMCSSKYVGPSCQYENPCVNQNPCLNSGTCFSRYNLNRTVTTQCFCLQGYTGSRCEAILCSPTSCNGGVCTATQNNIVCICPKGKVGDRCQYADACATNPCLSNERCEQIGSQYQCISCYDKSSYCSIYQLRNEYCDNRYTILVDNNFLPVPQACQRSCGQCISIQRLQDISSLFHHEELVDETNTRLSTTTSKNLPQEKCIDRRDDCLMQKAYGFCRILNEKYPEDCVKTCHPDCINTV